MSLGILSIPALGALAYGAAHSVSDNPKPQVVIPASPIRLPADTPATGGNGEHRGSVPSAPPDANPATHDVGDDRGSKPTTPATTHPDDNLAAHDVGDDHGIDATVPTTGVPDRLPVG